MRSGVIRSSLADKGAFLGRIVDIGAELFAISSAVIYADTMGREQPARKQEAIELAELFCNQARHRSDRRLTSCGQTMTTTTRASR